MRSKSEANNAEYLPLTAKSWIVILLLININIKEKT